MIDDSTPNDTAANKPPKSSGRIEYMRSFHYIFENPNWTTNVLFVGLCLLTGVVIPVVGHLIVQGYQFAILEALHLRPDSRYPDFDTHKLLDYLLRGFWIFLVSLVLAVAMLPVLACIAGLFVAVIVAASVVSGEEGFAIAIMVVSPILFLAFVAVCLAINVSFMPFVLRAGLIQDFGASFDLGFAKQFIRNTWWEIILCAMFSMVAGLLLSVVGLAMVCVGIYFTMSIAAFMGTHLTLQIYQLHLARGGDLIVIPATTPPE